jgi:hypothetical protein
MIVAIMVWLYFALLISVMQWPNKLAMLTSFVLLATPPLFLLYRVFVARRKSGNDPAEDGVKPSVQAGVGNVDRQDAGSNQ